MAVSWRSYIRPIVIRTTLAWEWWQSGVTYYPLAPRVYRNPYPTYAKLRAQDPVHWNFLSHSWVFSRYRDIDAILRDHSRFSNDARYRQEVSQSQAAASTPGGPSMLFLDPPDHARLRALVQQAFTPRAIEALTPRIRQIAANLLDQVADPTSFEVMKTLARPLPMIVMAELLGVPTQDLAQFQAWSHLRARVIEPTITARERRLATQAAYELDAYFLGLIEQRRTEPQDDLISALVAAEAAGDQLSHDELLVMLRLLLVAGNETTTNLIGNGLLALLRHPEQLHILRSDPSLIAGAVDELLRYDAPVQVVGRTATQDMEVGGRSIRKGQGIVLLLGSANRDPEVFDHPDRLDVQTAWAQHPRLWPRNPPLLGRTAGPPRGQNRLRDAAGAVCGDALAHSRSPIPRQYRAPRARGASRGRHRAARRAPDCAGAGDKRAGLVMPQ